MRGRTLLLLVALATTVTTIGTTAAGAQPPEFPGNDRAREHARIVEYWTPDRVANAIPRAMIRDGVPTGHKPGHTPGGPGGGGGGGGGGGETAVGGAPWTLGGLVKATTGKVLFTMGETNYVCSGTVVDDTSNSTSLVLTAGHCVYDSGDGWATNWMFVPDYEHAATFACENTRYGCWTASALVTTTAWAGGDFDHDYGFAVMGAGGLTGAQLDAAVGDQAIAFNQTHPAFVYSFGYPHASPYDGQDLIYCSGTDRADTFGGSSTFGLKCDMTGGSSGGGWYIRFDETTATGALTSVNSFKYRGGPMKSYMFGPYFGSYAEKTYNAAKTAGGNTLVTP